MVILSQRDRSWDRSWNIILVIIAWFVAILASAGYILYVDDAPYFLLMIQTILLLVVTWGLMWYNREILTSFQMRIYSDRVVLIKASVQEVMTFDKSVVADVNWMCEPVEDGRPIPSGLKPQTRPSDPSGKYYTDLYGLIFQKENLLIVIGEHSDWIIEDMDGLWDMFIDIVKRRNLPRGERLERFLHLNEIDIN